MVTSNPVFVHAGPKPLDELLQGARVLELKARQGVLAAGEPAAHVYVLSQGSVRVFHQEAGGRQSTVKHLLPPNTFGEMEVLRECTYQESVETPAPTTLVQLAAEPFRRYVQRDGRAAYLLLVDVCGRFCVAARNERSVFCDIPVRLASLLLSYAEVFGQQTPDGVRLRLGLSQQDLANGLGATVRSVSRVLTEWKSRDVIITRKGRIVVRNPHALAEICAST